MTMLCPHDGNPIEPPELETGFSFPDDVSPIIDVIEGRFNTTLHAECQQHIPFLTEVAVIDRGGNTFLVIDPSETNRFVAEVRKMAAEHEIGVIIVNDYAHLREELIHRVNRYVEPALQACLERVTEKPTASDLIELVSPLVLRVLKSSVDGYIVPFLQFSNAVEEDKPNLLRQYYCAIVSDQIGNIAVEALRRSELLSLISELEVRVPAECITPEVLNALSEKCQSYVAPDKDPAKFRSGYFHEHTHAAAYAVAGKPNPRTREMAMFMTTAWLMDRRGFIVDSQLLLNADIARRIVRFGDLWDLAMGGLERSTNFENAVGDGLALLKHYGFEKEALATMRTGVLRLAADSGDIDRLVPALEEGLLEKIKFAHDPVHSETAGTLVAGSVRTLLRNGQPEAALKLIRSLLDKALEAGDRVAIVAISIETAEVFNGHELFTEAHSLVSGVIDRLGDTESLSPGLLIQAWTVIGNVLRYRLNHDKAIDAYTMALRIVEATHDEQIGATQKNVLDRNLGIVYRDLGQYQKASKLLEQAAKNDPDNHQIQHNLATLYQCLNRRPEALFCLNRAIELAGGGTNEQVRRPYLLSRAVLHRDLGQTEEGLRDLMAAMKGAPTLVTSARVAASALQFVAVSEEGRQFVEQCREIVVDALTGNHTLQPSLRFLLYTELADALLADGKILDAQTVLDSAQEWLEEANAKGPWQLDFSLANLSHALGDYQDCWMHLETAWEKLDGKVPRAADARFAAFWLLDKARYQSELTRMVTDLARRGTVSSETLLFAYDFVNGREISSRIGAGKNLLLSRFQVCEQAAQLLGLYPRPVAVVFALETAKQVLVYLAIYEDGAWKAREALQLEPQKVLAVRKSFDSALRGANPSDLPGLDKELKGWRELSTEIGTALRNLLPEDSHVLVLPGRALTGLPLHLSFLTETTLLMDRHTVSYAPNLMAFVAAERQSAKSAGYSVVTVTGQKDRERFRQRALDSSERLITRLERNNVGVQYIRQEGADHAAVKEAMKSAREIIFVCHGTTAGFEGGYGICIAHNGALPPRVISVQEFPDHSNYILSWRDVEEAPSVFVSIACSSGRTDVTESGVRFGLEQSLFSGGTRTIISPLWDVDQEASLLWIETFYSYRLAHSDWSLIQAYRQTCEDVRKKFEHFYYWAPFVINGSFR